jgi:hypothetical protein
MAAPANTVNPQQANAYASMLVRQRAKKMVQRTYQQVIAYTSGTANVINIPLRPVGLLTALKVVVSGTFTAGAGGHGATRTDAIAAGTIGDGHGAANFLSNISLIDLSSNTRVNAPGWYLHALATVRRNAPFTAAFTSDDTSGYGANFPVNSCPAAIAAGVTSTAFRHVYDVPVAYGPDDLRGAIYAAVTSATLNLQLTLNANIFAAPATNGVESVYSCLAAGAASEFSTTGITVQVYQEYFDMLPVDPNSGMVILPPLDLAKAYMINSSVYTGLAATAEFPISFANWREFQSAFFIYDNAGILNVGGDISNILLQTANLTSILQFDPFLCQAYTRERIGMDMPDGTYYIDFRRQPLITQEFGNLQLTVTPSAVTAGARLLVGWEAIADQNTVMLSGAFRQN